MRAAPQSAWPLLAILLAASSAHADGPASPQAPAAGSHPADASGVAAGAQPGAAQSEREATIPRAFDDPNSVFHIERNKNRNQVHYGIRLDSACRPEGTEPVYNYWLRLEEGPGVTKPVTFFQQAAYGIREQVVSDEATRVVLRALPERAVTILAARDRDRCTARAYIEIGGARSRFEHAYVFAEEGLLRPHVVYIDLFGTAEVASPVRERVGVE